MYWFTQGSNKRAKATYDTSVLAMFPIMSRQILSAPGDLAPGSLGFS